MDSPNAITATRTNEDESMVPVVAKSPSNHLRFPSINTQTKKPIVANKDRKLSNTALIGSNKDPVNKKSKINVVPTIHSTAHGKLFVIPRSESV